MQELETLAVELSPHQHNAGRVEERMRQIGCNAGRNRIGAEFVYDRNRPPLLDYNRHCHGMRNDQCNAPPIEFRDQGRDPLSE